MVTVYLDSDVFLGRRGFIQDGMIRSSSARQGRVARRVNPRLLGLALSLSGMFLGIALLLVCMYFYAVPHVLTAEFLLVTCTVTIQKDDHQLFSYCGPDQTDCLTQGDKKIHVALTLEIPPAPQSTCAMVHADYVSLSGTHVQKANVFLDPWTYYQNQLDANRCPCPHCDTGIPQLLASDTAAKSTPPGGSISKDSHFIDCYYNPFKENEVVLEKLTPMLVLNAMLWPTILFISGFVGVFLSCIMR